MRPRAVILALLLVAVGAGRPAVAAIPFTLRSHCPPSFVPGPAGECRLATLYQFYRATPGQGGLRAPLPPVRDGFRPAEIDLGRYLFFDPLLSGDGTLSCAHCHHPALGLADGRATSSGYGGRGVGPSRTGGAVLPRSAPSLWNVAFLDRLFWDGRAHSLEEQVAGPLFSANEMGGTPASLLAALNGNDTYRRLFAQAFGRGRGAPITMAEVARALAAFESSLISLNSRYDHYAHGDSGALSASEVRGLNVFRSFVSRCSQCHVPPLFASSELAAVGAPAVPGVPYDLGAGALAANPTLNGAFRVPTLRNITRTAPYFQAGQLRTLDEVVGFYNDRRGHAVPAGADVTIHWHVHMQSAELIPGDVADLVAFLGSLTDELLLPDVPERVPSGLAVVPLSISEAKGLP